jgi:hypothetical protein
LQLYYSFVPTKIRRERKKKDGSKEKITEESLIPRLVLLTFSA